MEAPSFAHRRPAASHLPAFSLPSPGPGQDIPSMHHHPSDLGRGGAPLGNAPSSSSANPAQGSLPPASRILTPTSGVTSDGLSPSSGLNTGGSHNSHQAGNQNYTHGSWQQSTGSYSYSSAGPNPSVASLAQSFQSGSRGWSQGMHSFNSRPSPSSGANDGSQSTGATGYQPSDVQAFNASMSGGSANPTGTLPSQQSYPPSSILGSQAPATQPHSPAIPSSVGTDYRHPQTPVYSQYPATSYPPSSTPVQSSYQFAPQPSPVHHSPVTTGPGGRLMSAPSPLTPMSSSTPYGSAAPRPVGYNSYAVPSPMAHPVMTNMGNPGGPLAMVGGHGVHGIPAIGLPSYPHHHQGHPMSHMFGGPQQQPINDRPFKCDQCPQSFNRNHDLKRHKRIHLAVKPFPCNHCDKSFSRKDALKRHRLVKRCGDQDAKTEEGSNATGDMKLEDVPAKKES